MNSENSKTFKSHILVLKLTNKLGLRIGEKTVTFSNLNIYYTWKSIKHSYNIKKFKISVPHGMINLNYLMDHILYQIFKIISSIF